VPRKPSKNGPKTDGRFKPGNKLGKGRPAGSRNKATLAADALLDGEGLELTRVCIEAAKGGDMTAMRLCLERAVPVRRGRPVTFKLPPIERAEDVQKAIAAIIAATAAGDLTPEEAASIAALLEANRKAIEVVEIERRLEALEARQGGAHEPDKKTTGET
jgi:hypothetical protein